MAKRLLFIVSVAMLLTTFGCATNEQTDRAANEQPGRTESDMSGRPYVLAMGRYLAAAQQFTVTIRTEKDDILDQDVVVGPTVRTVSLRRPDRLAVQLVHPQGRRQIWYDGTRLVTLDVNRNAYASVPAKGTLGDLFAQLRRDNHYVRPLAGLCDADPGLTLCANARSVAYLGKKTLNGRPCNVVRIERKDAVVDLWIADGDQPLLLQTAVRQTSTSQPERISSYQNWNLQARLTEAEFKPRVPANAYQVELYDVTGMP